MEDYTPNTYATRNDLERLRRELTVRGDGQTLTVDTTAAGQILRSLVPIGAAAEKDRIFTATYDPVADEFTLAWQTQYVTDRTKTNYDAVLLPAGSLKWTATTTSTIFLYVANVLGPKFYWMATGTAAGADADTLAVQLESAPTMLLLGTISITVSTSKKIKITFPNVQPLNYKYQWSIVPSSSNALYPLDYVGFTTIPISFIQLGNSFDDQLIVGWNKNTGAVTLAAYATYATYDDYLIVGRAKTDGSGNLRKLTLTIGPSTQYREPGPSGTISYAKPGGGSGSITIVNGRVTTWT